MKSHGLLTGLVAFLLIMFGPFLPWYLGIHGLVWRILYIVSLPIVTWFVLKLIWRTWALDSETDERFSCAVWGAVAGGLSGGAVLLAQAKPHGAYTCCDRLHDERVRARYWA